ncbi:Fn3-like domain protein [uncultured archaeon]|nr:Fn3-like domain protein [uncultured archaeon]
MNKYASIVAAILVLGMFAGIEAGNIIPVQAQDTAVQGVSAPAPVTPAVAEQTGNFTKIDISPQYGNFRLQPGENKEITVTVRNKEKKAVNVKPNTVILPYGGYVVDPEWVTVTPGSTEIPAGGSQKFIIKASVPKDASIGNSGLQIAFTDEVMPTPYPQPIPNYIHAFQLSIDVWTPPKIQIMMPYINDQLEAGKEYNYDIKLKNTGDQAIGINPKLGSDMLYGGPYGMTAPALTEDSITITAPQRIQAGATETVKLHVKVPSDAKGYYNGYIDLEIDDPSIRDWEGRVQLSFNIWKQPTENFIKNFSLKESVPITIEISSNNYYGYPPINGQGTNAKVPSFDTSLEGPGGKAPLNVTKTVIKGNVNMGGDRPPWEIDSASIYQEMGIQYVVTYRTNGSPGEWKLSVLPMNTQGFDYSITIGG